MIFIMETWSLRSGCCARRRITWIIIVDIWPIWIVPWIIRILIWITGIMIWSFWRLPAWVIVIGTLCVNSWWMIVMRMVPIFWIIRLLWSFSCDCSMIWIKWSWRCRCGCGCCCCGCRCCCCRWLWTFRTIGIEAPLFLSSTWNAKQILNIEWIWQPIGRSARLGRIQRSQSYHKLAVSLVDHPPADP